MIAEACQSICNRFSTAVCITRERGGKTQYRIAPYQPFRDDQVPYGGYLSGWCSTEDRAWQAALQRRGVVENRRDHW
jgi:hypothetical protein